SVVGRSPAIVKASFLVAPFAGASPLPLLLPLSLPLPLAPSAFGFVLSLMPQTPVTQLDHCAGVKTRRNWGSIRLASVFSQPAISSSVRELNRAATRKRTRKTRA